MEHEAEYGHYLRGCNRLGQIPVSKEEFLTRWQEFEQYAEQLKTAEAAGSVEEIDKARRAEMQQRLKDDPFVQAILVGLAEDVQGA
jgi:hypothetical protein